MKRLRVTPEVAVDWTKCFGYEVLVSEEIEHYSAIEVTEDLKEGGIAANQAWELWYRFLAATWRTDFGTEISEAARRFEVPRLLSLGCGYGGMEIACARRLRGRPYEILAVDVNENLFRRAREEVAREGFHVEFQSLDLNFAEIEEDAFDVVFAHASLHHLLNFEHLFSQLHRALRDGGRLIVLDIIGKTQVLFWPENVRFATDLVARMPERYRRGLAIDPAALFPGYIDGAAQEGMEGIRQEEIEEQIGLWFHPLRTFKYNSFVRLICTHMQIAPNFDPHLAADRAYLESLFRLDLEQIAKGTLRATEMFAIYEKRPQPEAGARGGWARPRGNPRVSVCVACEGSAAALQTSFASLQAQTHKNLEILLLLPALGPDDVAALARELAARHADTRLIPSAPGEGNGAVDWRAGLTAAGGEYIALLSSRDAWYPVKLSEQVAFLEEHPAVGLAFAQAIVVDERGRRTARAFGTDVIGEDISGAALERLIEGYEIPRSTAVFRRAGWGQVELEKGAAVTPENLWLQLAARGQVGFQARTLGMLRVPEEMAVADSEALRRRQLEALRRLRGAGARRLTEPRIADVLARRLAALGGTVEEIPVERPAGPRLLRRILRRLIGRRA